MREAMDEFLDFRSSGLTLVCGADEAGRGPLCGPVVAAACILPAKLEIDGLDDSKKLPPKKREKLFDEIKQNALTYCIAQATVDEINRVNILEASLLAMRRAIEGLYPLPEAALIDGNVERDFQLPARAVIHGDALVPSIAAASILAKVTRDRMCLALDAQYPQYGIKGHKGYGTKAHMDALRRYGPSPIHRTRFIRFLTPNADDASTEADRDEIARIKQRAAWDFPSERKPDLSGSVIGLPSYILDYKHAEATS